MLVASTEAEFRVVPVLGFATFIDGGSAGRGSFDELEWGAGVGRLTYPQLPIPFQIQ